MKKIAVFASGSGSNLQAIIDAAERGQITGAQIALVVSDRKNAYALTRAANHGIPAKYFYSRNYLSREEFDRDVVACLDEHQIELVVLAGFMRILSPYFILAYQNKIMNIHPALLPAFPGAHGVADALAYGVKVTGCTVHFADFEVDSGPIILQEAVSVCHADTVESLHARIQELEHRLYPRAIDLWAHGKLKIEGRRCIILDSEAGLN